jgi:sulfite reductase (ferredoxin)
MVAVDRLAFSAQIALEEGRAEQAGQDALTSMLKAAKALVQIQYDDVTEDDPEEIIDEFKERFYDTEKFFDPFAGSKFADYLFAAWENKGVTHTAESARTLIEEAQLFSEAVHACYNRIRTEGLGEKAEA